MGDTFGIGQTVAGTLQSAATLGAAGMNAAAQRDYNDKYLQGVRETNESNRRQAELQNQWNLQQWYRENEYNSPAAQIQRLRSAGLSAAAAAQSVSGGTASPLQSADLSVDQAPQPLQAPQFDLSGLNIIGIARALEDLRQSKLQTKMMQYEEDITPRKLFTEQQVRDATLRDMEFNYKKSVEEQPYHLRSLKYDTRVKKEDVKVARLRVEQIRQNLQAAREELGFLRKLRPVQLKQAFQSLAKTFEETENAHKQGKILDQTFARNAVLSAFDKFGGVPDNFLGRMAILVASGKIKPEDIDSNVRNFSEIINYLIKGVKSSLGNSSVNVLSGLVFGDPQSEDDANIARKANYYRKKVKQDAAGDHSMGTGDVPPFEE